MVDQPSFHFSLVAPGSLVVMRVGVLVMLMAVWVRVGVRRRLTLARLLAHLDEVTHVVAISHWRKVSNGQNTYTIHTHVSKGHTYKRHTNQSVSTQQYALTLIDTQPPHRVTDHRGAAPLREPVLHKVVGREAAATHRRGAIAHKLGVRRVRVLGRLHGGPSVCVCMLCVF